MRSTDGNTPQHLSQISTAWTCLFQAHGQEQKEQCLAREELLRIYSGPIRRYLMSIVGKPDVVDELYQEFALRLVRGDFRRVAPDRGRFRDFVKSVLYHLVVDHYRIRARAASNVSLDKIEYGLADDQVALSDTEFLECWRNELLARTWHALEKFEKHTKQITYTVLRLRTDHPDLKSAHLAERLSTVLNETVSEQWVRKRLHVARKKLTELLLDEISRTLDNATSQDIEDELEALGLTRYVKLPRR